MQNCKHRRQCDQIGQILKDLSDKYSCKSCQNIWWFFSCFEKLPFLSKNCQWPLFGQVMENLGCILLYPLVTLMDVAIVGEVLFRWDLNPSKWSNKQPRQNSHATLTTDFYSSNSFNNIIWGLRRRNVQNTLKLTYGFKRWNDS